MYKVSQGIRSTHGQDGAIVLVIGTGRVLWLNTAGALILRRLQEGATEPQIVNELKDCFGVSISIAVADVCEFLKTLEQMRVVCRHPADISSLGEGQRTNGHSQ